MDNVVFSTYKVDDRSYISFIKREIHNLVTQAGFSSQRAGEVDIIVSELTSNLDKYAGSGELLYRLCEEGVNTAFEIFCIDGGPGIGDIAKMMQDGASSSNTLGHGLGAMNRLSDVFQVYSMEGWGTIAYSKTYKESVRPYQKVDLDVMGLQVCFPGEKVCGDGYKVKKNGNLTQLFLGDGLGHGPNAHEAVQQAIEAFETCPESDNPCEILRFIHLKVRKTRGLVGTVAILDKAKKQWNICGVGNISTKLCHGMSSKNYMSNNGILGMNIPHTMHNYTVDADANQFIIMYSDGIKTRWEISRYQSIFKYDPAVISAAIFKDNTRRNDDTTVLVGKLNL